MTMEEAIEHCEEVAHSYDCTAPDCKCAEEHRQLAEWLRELHAWRKAYDDCVNTDYESIDDSVRRLTIIGKVVNVENVFANIRRTNEERKSD